MLVHMTSGCYTLISSLMFFISFTNTTDVNYRVFRVIMLYGVYQDVQRVL